ncbi:MAG: ATP-binding protein [Vulcanimicrobiaceae bacterium]
MVGARQVGKSTLAELAATTPPGEPLFAWSDRQPRAGGAASATITRYVSLDDATTLAAARADPQGFLGAMQADDWTVIDEVQRAPELFVAIKRAVDRDRRPGRYLLTGSTSALFLATMATELAGRIEVIDLWPLAQCEIESVRADFLAAAFDGRPPQCQSDEPRQATLARAARGGYPEAVARADPARRAAWFGSYVTTVIQREIRSLSAIGDEAAIVRVLRALAMQSGSPRNVQAISQAVALPASTVKRYVDLLEAVYLVKKIAPWSRNIEKRFVKSPKYILTDSGLYGHLLAADLGESRRGLLLEAFVGNELLRLASAEPVPPTLLFFRLQNGAEVDFVLEASDGGLVGVEVKAATSVSRSDFRGLEALREIAGRSFCCGVVVHCGERTLPFGDRLFSVPIAALWQSASAEPPRRIPFARR